MHGIGSMRYIHGLTRQSFNVKNLFLPAYLLLSLAGFSQRFSTSIGDVSLSTDLGADRQGVVAQGGGTRWWHEVVAQGGGTRWWHEVVARGGGTRVVISPEKGGANTLLALYFSVLMPQVVAQLAVQHHVFPAFPYFFALNRRIAWH